MRFTDIDKWKDKWFRSLEPTEKLLYFYLLENCDNAGFIEIDIELWAFQIRCGADDLEGALKGLARGLIVGDDWVFIRSFLTIQKNLPLNENNNAHKQIIKLINIRSSHFDINEITQNLGANEGLISPIGKGKGKGKGKGNEGGAGGNTQEGKHLFKNSPFFELSAFKDKILEDENYSCFDLDYYHESAKLYSDQGHKYKNWVSAVKNWMRRDLTEGKARLSNGNQSGNQNDIDNWGN